MADRPWGITVSRAGIKGASTDFQGLHAVRTPRCTYPLWPVLYSQREEPQVVVQNQVGCSRGRERDTEQERERERDTDQERERERE